MSKGVPVGDGWIRRGVGWAEEENVLDDFIANFIHI